MSFSVERIKREARFAAAAESTKRDPLPVRDVEVNALEVVDANISQMDFSGHGSSSFQWFSGSVVQWFSGSVVQWFSFRCLVFGGRNRNFKFQISNFRFQISDLKFQISNFRSQIQISDLRSQISDFEVLD